MYDVLCVAETCCDIIFSGLPKMPGSGQEEYCREFSIKAGGGSNTAMGLAKLGLHTRMLTQLGKDRLGEVTYHFMEETGLDMSAVRYDSAVETAVSAVLSTMADRGFASYGGNQFELSREMLEQQIRNCRHVHTFLGYCTVFPIAELCREYGKTLSLDTAGGDQMPLGEVADILRVCSVFTPNDVEACRLAGTDDVEEALHILSGYCDNVVVTCGAEGSIACCGGTVYRAAPVRVACVKDSTGAGDMFCAGYLYGFLNGWGPQERLAFANRTGALAVTYCGGMDEAFSKENAEKL